MLASAVVHSLVRSATTSFISNPSGPGELFRFLFCSLVSFNKVFIFTIQWLTSSSSSLVRWVSRDLLKVCTRSLFSISAKSSVLGTEGNASHCKGHTSAPRGLQGRRSCQSELRRFDSVWSPVFLWFLQQTDSDSELYFYTKPLRWPLCGVYTLELLHNINPVSIIYLKTL